MNLAPNVFLATIGDQAVVLDLEHDRYIGLGARPTAAALALLGKDTGPAARARHATGPDLALHRRTLVARGILSEHASPQPVLNPPVGRASAWPDTLPTGPKPTPWRPTLSALRALGDVELALRARPFRSTIAWLRRAKARRRGPASASVQELIDAFGNARPWFPIKPICRLDAMAICLHFWRNGQDATLIFGVRLQPFHAHCWAQAGPMVLNEAEESTHQYTPIMGV